MGGRGVCWIRASNSRRSIYFQEHDLRALIQGANELIQGHGTGSKLSDYSINGLRIASSTCRIDRFGRNHGLICDTLIDLNIFCRETPPFEKAKASAEATEA